MVGKRNKLPIIPRTYDSLPPIHSGDGSNMTQLKPSPPAYVQENALSTVNSSSKVLTQNKTSQDLPPTPHPPVVTQSTTSTADSMSDPARAAPPPPPSDPPPLPPSRPVGATPPLPPPLPPSGPPGAAPPPPPPLPPSGPPGAAPPGAAPPGAAPPGAAPPPPPPLPPSGPPGAAPPPPPPPPPLPPSGPPGAAPSSHPPFPPGKAIVSEQSAMQHLLPPSSVEGLVPKPPDIPKSLSSRSTTDKQKHALPPVSLRLSKAYIANWTLEDADMERCVEDVTFAIKLLQKHLPDIIMDSLEFTSLFSLLLKATSKHKECSLQNKTRMVQLILDQGWVSFLKEYLTNMFAIDQWEYKYVSVASENLVKGIQTLCQPIFSIQPEIACQIFDQFFDVVYTNIDHPISINLARGLHLSAGSMVVRSLLDINLHFTMSPEILNTKMTVEQKKQVRSLLTNYTHHLREGSEAMVTCLKTLNYLDEEESPFAPLPLKYLAAPEAFHNSPDKLEEDIVYVVKRLASVSVESILTKPWKYEWDFRFLLNATKEQKQPSDQSKENWTRYYRALLKDGIWHKFLIGVHTAALIKVKSVGEKTSTMTCALFNIMYGFAIIRNGTDLCKDSQLLQQTFDETFAHMLENLRYNASKRSSMKNGDSVIGLIGASMVSCLHNLSYYHEPCVPVMRGEGMITVARQLRNYIDDSSITTDCLLIIAFLMNESDDKKWLRMTDEELSYLLDELKKSMLAAGASNYHPEELIDGLSRIAVSDINKLKLIESGILKLLAKSLSPVKLYTDAHRVAAVKALWNLAFNEFARKEIKERKALMAALKSLKDSPNKKLRAAVAGALWQLEGKEKHVVDIESSGTDVSEKHIMLSYNHQAKDEVFKMKDRLKQEGYKVWIDEEQITAGGSTLEAMSKAIEESCLVLIFFSEPYKNSVNCRAEAEYVFERRKPFLPVQVQAGYTPEGWLGILFGSKYRYTLSKPTKYNAEVAGLLGKIRELTMGPIQHTVTNDIPADAQRKTVSIQKHITCESWNTQQIQKWLKDNELSSYSTGFAQMDGGTLKELVMLYSEHKDAFYTLLSSKTPGMSLCDTLRLGTAVQKLAME